MVPWARQSAPPRDPSTDKGPIATGSASGAPECAAPRPAPVRRARAGTSSSGGSAQTRRSGLRVTENKLFQPLSISSFLLAFEENSQSKEPYFEWEIVCFEVLFCELLFRSFTEESADERPEGQRLIGGGLAVAHGQPVQRNAEGEAGVVHQRAGVLVLGHARQDQEAQLRAVVGRLGARVLHHDRTALPKKTNMPFHFNRTKTSFGFVFHQKKKHRKWKPITKTLTSLACSGRQNTMKSTENVNNGFIISRVNSRHVASVQAVISCQQL